MKHRNRTSISMLIATAACAAAALVCVIGWSATGDGELLRLAAAPLLLSVIFYVMHLSALADAKHREQVARAAESQARMNRMLKGVSDRERDNRERARRRDGVQ